MNRDFASTQLAPSPSALAREQHENVRTTSSSSGERMTPLAIDFVPTADDVICGRGKKCYNHIGNELFRRRVVSMLGEYRKTRSKLEKSKVLSDVVEQVRQNSPLGGFVKQDETGRWYEVGDFLAREKTSQAFRDALHDNYKSSNVAKKKRRQEEQSKAATTSKASKLARASDFDIFKSMDKLTSSMARISRGGGSSIPSFEKRSRLTREMRHDYGPSSFGLDCERRLSEENTNAAPASSGYSSSEDSIFRPYRSTSILDSNNRPRSHSVPSSPLNFPSRSLREDQEESLSSAEEWQRRDLHHSMPNIHFSFSNRCRAQSIDEMEEMHHSLPNMNFEAAEAEFDFEPEETTMVAPAAAIDTTTTSMMTMEPIPLNIAFTGARTEHVPSSTHAAHHAAGYHHHDQIPMERVESSSISNISRAPVLQPLHPGSSSAEQQHAPPSDSISRDLILCLEKLTESTIADPDDPYAPIPLSPQGPKRRPSLAVNKRDFPKIDDLAPSSTFDV